MFAEILFVIGCAALWLACGMMMLVKCKIIGSNKVSVSIPISVMTVAVACMTISNLIG